MTFRLISNRAMKGCVAALILGSMIAGSAIAQQVQSANGLARPVFTLAQTASIQGSWVLRNMTEPPFPTPMVPSTELTADFSNGRVTGTGGCNRFNGGYKTTGSQIKIGLLASTFMACEEGIMTQEGRYLKALQAATRFQVSGENLEIFYKTDEGEGVLRFSSKSVRGLW